MNNMPRNHNSLRLQPSAPCTQTRNSTFSLAHITRAVVLRDKLIRRMLYFVLIIFIVLITTPLTVKAQTEIILPSAAVSQIVTDLTNSIESMISALDVSFGNNAFRSQPAFGVTIRSNCNCYEKYIWINFL